MSSRRRSGPSSLQAHLFADRIGSTYPMCFKTPRPGRGVLFRHVVAQFTDLWIAGTAHQRKVSKPSAQGHSLLQSRWVDVLSRETMAGLAGEGRAGVLNLILAFAHFGKQVEIWHRTRYLDHQDGKRE